jgi:hypothetical protein
MTVTEHVELERKDGLLVLTLANPDGNRIGLGVVAGLYQMIEGPLIRLAHRKFRFEEAEAGPRATVLDVDVIPGSGINDPSAPKVAPK